MHSINKKYIIDHSLTTRIFHYVKNNPKLLRAFELFRSFYNTLAIPLFILISILYHSLNFYAILIWAIIGTLNELFTKKIFMRQRPSLLKNSKIHKTKKIKGLSFPSGHALNSGIIAILALYYLPFALAIIVVIFSLLVAFSRVVLGFHYLFDVIVGFILGILSGIFLLILT